MPKPASPLAQRLNESLQFDHRLFYLILVVFFLVIRYLTNSLILEAIPDSERLEAQGDLMFFHIFNHLHQSGKQLILSSDKPPKDLEGVQGVVHLAGAGIGDTGRRGG